jgi:hypothetical protein
MSLLRFQTETCSQRFGRGNEATRTSYINEILRPALFAADKHSCIKISYEYSFPRQSKDAWGSVEFVFCANTPQSNPVAKIVEAKQRDFEKARAQLYMEMHLCYLHNLDFDKNADFPVFGAMTDAADWIFVRYDGKSFVESQRFVVQNLNDEPALKAVFNVIAMIITKQAQIVAPFVVFDPLYSIKYL